MIKALRLRRLGSNANSASDSWEELPGPAYQGNKDGADGEDADEEEGWSKLFGGKKEGKRKKKDFKIGFQSLTHILLILLIGLALLLVKGMDSRLPTSLTVSSLDNTTVKFIEERARQDLIELTGVGIRISGSAATDVVTVEKFKEILASIKNNDLHPKFSLEFEEQRPTGAFFMDDDEGHTSVYQEIANVVAKLELKDPSQRSNQSILFNCHFDTKPSSPGATDNMISCASMLETIRTLSSTVTGDQVMLRNTLLFLFNGAEELGLQGAHGFVRGDGGKGHRWAEEELVMFVNLEGAGAGGREILFQTGPGDGWILKGYAKSVPHPYGLVVAEEAFQLGLIPSDTDFRIFRDFRNIPGLDMAFIKNGWVYHTKWDKVTEIPPGSIQHMGDNTLGLAKYFGNLDFNKDSSKSDNKMIFFDIFGLFMVAYSGTVGIIINCIMAVIIFVITGIEVGVKVSSIKTYLWLPLSTFLAWGTGVAVSVFVGAFFNWAGYYKPFFSYPSLALVMYGVPAILSTSLVFSFAWRGSQKKAWLAAKFTTAILLLILTFVTRMVYILNMNLVFAIPNWILRRYVFTRFKYPRIELAAGLLIGELIPFLFSVYMMLTLVDVFVPIMGRTGTETNPNIFLGLILGAMICILAFNGLHSYLVNCKKVYLIVGLVLTIFVMSPLIVVGFVGKIPFQEKTPMRVRILNVDRTWHNPTNPGSPLDPPTVNRTDSGYWFWPVDPNTIDFFPEFSKTMPIMSNFEEIDSNINSCPDLYCNQLFLWPTSDSIKQTPWIPKTTGLPETTKELAQMKILRNVPVNGTQKRELGLTFDGPSQMSIVFSPGDHYDLINWDLGGLHVPKSGKVRYQGRPTYFIYVGNGYGVSRMDISLTFQLKEGVTHDPSAILTNVMYVGHFLHEAGVQEPSFVKLGTEFPSWTNVMAWTSVLRQYTIL